MEAEPDRPETPVIRVTDLDTCQTSSQQPLSASGDADLPRPTPGPRGASAPTPVPGSEASPIKGPGPTDPSEAPRPTRRRRKSKHIAFTVSTDSEDDDGMGTGLATPVGEGRRRSSPSILNNANGHGQGSPRKDSNEGYPPAGDGYRGGGRGGAAAETKETKGTKENTKKASAAMRMLDKALANPHIAWIKPKLNFNALKPVFRTSLSMWIGLLFILIHPVGIQMGQAAFLVLIMSIMVPPSAPFVQFLEILFNLFFYLSLSWAWCALGTAIAHSTRGPTDPSIVQAAMARHANETPDMQMAKVIFDATFLQARPAIICCIWLSVGTAALLWWKMRTAPSPATLPLVLSCILIDVSLTIVPLYPTAFYLGPWLVYKPICFQAGVALLCSIFVFPQSVSGQFRGRFVGVLNPLVEAMSDIESLFSDASTMSTFGTPTGTPKHARHSSITSYHDECDEVKNKVQAWGDRSAEIREVLLKSLAGMAPLNAQQRYLDVDISYGRIPGRDLREMFNVLASVQVRASGFSFFFNIIVNKVRRTHLDSKGFNAQRSLSMATLSRPTSRTSRTFSRPGSTRGSAMSLKEMRRSSEVPDHADSAPPTPRSATFDHDTPRDGYGSTEPGTPDDSEDEHNYSDREQRGRRYREHRHQESLAHRLLHSLPHSLPRSRETSPHSHRDSSRSRERKRKKNKDVLKGSTLSLTDSLRKIQQPVGVFESQRYMDLEAAEDRDFSGVIEQLELLSAGALPLVKALRKGLGEAVTWSTTSDSKRHAHARDIAQATAYLRVTLEEFKEHRGVVTKPYRHLFDPLHKRERSHLSRVQHMGLFYCLVASYHLIEFSDALLKFLDMLIEKDDNRQKRRLWVPSAMKLFSQFRASVQREHSDGPDESQESTALDHSEEQDDGDMLGEVRGRNPDYEPFSSWGMGLISKLSYIPDFLFSRSAMYAVKAGVLGCLMSLPAFLASSASFYYYNRGIWCTIMAQMTLAVFAGDTFASWISRLLASFWGGLIGLIVWYMGSGHGPGNPYGLAVVTAVFFPPMMLFRVHWPGPPLTSIVFCTSVNLVIGYSYLNGHLFKLSNATWGFDVAWLRFVCVVIGITAAWIFSLVPPSYSAKRALRCSYARSIANVGHILCQELSAANDPHSVADMTFNQHVRTELLAQRAKLTKLGVRHGMAERELSLRGAWPKDAYQGLQNTLVETMSLLAQFNHLLPQMPPNWRKALLLRTRMCDPIFLGDVLAVISMTSSALRAATPLPQITPGPLIAKYHMNRYKGLDLPKDPAEVHDDMPTFVTVEVLESDNYMRYALGVSTIYALMSRLDSIVVVCKTLLGENYHIDNLRFTETIQLMA